MSKLSEIQKLENASRAEPKAKRTVRLVRMVSSCPLAAGSQ